MIETILIAASASLAAFYALTKAPEYLKRRKLAKEAQAESVRLSQIIEPQGAPKAQRYEPKMTQRDERIAANVHTVSLGRLHSFEDVCPGHPLYSAVQNVERVFYPWDPAISASRKALRIIPLSPTEEDVTAFDQAIRDADSGPSIDMETFRGTPAYEEALKVFTDDEMVLLFKGEADPEVVSRIWPVPETIVDAKNFTAANLALIGVALDEWERRSKLATALAPSADEPEKKPN